MAYKVIIMPPAKRKLDMYVHYTIDGMFHELQDYEGILISELHLD